MNDLNSSSTTRCCPVEEAPINLLVSKNDFDEELALMAKAIGHPTRVKILKLLSRKDTCVCGEIVESTELAQSTVSQHLKVLKEANLIHGKINGTATCYFLNHLGLERLKMLVENLWRRE